MSVCVYCSKPAACVGRYEGQEKDEPACDTCCGHSCEDGHCEPLPPKTDKSLQAQVSRLREALEHVAGLYSYQPCVCGRGQYRLPEDVREMVAAALKGES